MVSIIMFMNLTDRLNTFYYYQFSKSEQQFFSFLASIAYRSIQYISQRLCWIINLQRRVICVTARRLVAKKLAHNMGALLMRSPPTCLNPMREYFNDNLVLRRAYFSLCMYANAINVTRFWYNHTVIMSAWVRYLFSACLLTCCSDWSEAWNGLLFDNLCVFNHTFLYK